MIRGLFILNFLVMSVLCAAQDRVPAFEMNERLGRGINMGNSFEAPTETEWGNPWQPSYFERIADLGFKHVRVPIRWDTPERSLSSPPYTINSTFLERIQEVVDAALDNDLLIIINMHHHDALFEDPSGGKERFLSQWEQIASYFKDYPDNLLFEVLNEPHGNLTPSLWNEFFQDALDVIRETNPTRVVLMGVAEFGGLGGISKLVIPEDDYIILSPHYYNPFTFTHQGAEWSEGSDAWLGTQWLDTEMDREAVESDFRYALEFSETYNIPIHVGEFGAYNKADLASRSRWTTFLARWFEQNNMSWAYWEFSAGFGIFNPATQQYNTDLVNALLHNPMPKPIPVFAIPVYNSNFSSGTDGWALTQQGGASGNLASSSSGLNVSITSPGTEAWHLQLVKGNIKLEKDKQYRLMFTAKAQEGRSVVFYAGRASSPWNIYSGSNSVNLGTSEATFTSVFVMNEPTDANARLVFDLGTNTSTVTITNIKVEEITMEAPVTSVSEQSSYVRVRVLPNPVISEMRIENDGGPDAMEIIDTMGRRWTRHRLHEPVTVLSMDGMPAGIYIARFDSGAVLKFIKR